MIVLDSTVLIDHLRGRPAAQRVSRLAQSHEIVATTAINVEEIVRGLRVSERAAADKLFAGLVVLPIGQEEAVRAGEWRRDFGAQGITLSQANCLIAACVMAASGRLATGNPQDFPMTGLQVEDWPVGI